MFIAELEKSTTDFKAQTEQMQRWANTSLATVDVKAILDTIMQSDKNLIRCTRYTIKR